MDGGAWWAAVHGVAKSRTRLSNTAYQAFYHANQEHGVEDPMSIDPWYTNNAAFHEYWLRAIYEMIDRFQPELLYTDGALPFGHHWMGKQAGESSDGSSYACGLRAVAHLYNTSIAKHGSNQAVYLQKDRDPNIYNVGVLDIEKSQLPGVMPQPWHTDTCIGNWFYDVHSPYKRPDQIVEMLVDIISKNGVMLLNILQRPDGTIDDEADFILARLAEWFRVCGEAVYGTRPWQTFREGDTLVKIEGFREDKTQWRRNDFRFVQKDGAVYAFMLGLNGGDKAVLYSFSDRRVASVELLGYGPVPFKQEYGVLIADLPDKLPAFCANALKIR